MTLTVISVYFSFEKFTQESIVTLKSKLIDKEIAFDKQSLYDFSFDFDYSKSAIVFGLSSYDKLFSELAAEAYNNAKNDAKVIVSATGNKLGELLRVSGCSDKLEGSVNLSDNLNLTGKNLGPLSLDPKRLLVKFSTTYEFAILD